MVEGCDAHRLVQVTRKVLDSPCPFDNVRYFKKNENISFFHWFYINIHALKKFAEVYHCRRAVRRDRKSHHSLAERGRETDFPSILCD